MEISGSVESVVFRNNENGYTVLTVKCKGGFVTMSGKFPPISSGEDVLAEGEWRENAKYGKQFVCENVRIKSPTTKEQLVKYLSSGLISGVGPVTAKAIVDKFGDKTLEIIETNPQKISTVKGVSVKKAIDIARTVGDIKKMQDAMMFLQKFDVSIGLAVKIYDRYKTLTEKILLENPYKLIEDIDGVGFKTADKIAQKIGIDETSEFRMRAGIIHVLTALAETTGSTVFLRKELHKKVCALLGCLEEETLNRFDSVLVRMMIDGVLTEIANRGQEEKIALSKYYLQEKAIASGIKRLQITSERIVVDVDADIKEFERISGITLHESQVEAVKMAVCEGVCVITGGPGTGKTTIVKAILKILNARGSVCSLTAPTGRAAKRLSESTGVDAATIHRLLGSDYASGFRRFGFNERNQLPSDVVIVDEASMLDTYLAASLTRAIKSGCKLILVGDKDQLPSVGAGNVLADLISSKQLPVVHLSRIFRQGKESLIVENAHRINKGEMPILDNNESDFFFVSKNDPALVLSEIKELVGTRLPKFKNTSWKNIQVIAPTKMGPAGVESLNSELQRILNKENAGTEVEIASRKFRVGDRVMQTANNYEQKWTHWRGDSSDSGSTSQVIVEGEGVFNGEIGYVAEINQKLPSVVVDFEDGRRASFMVADVADLSLAYAVTVHKSQGSEFDIVVIPVASGNPFLFNRNLLYTAVTRAKKLVVVVGKRQDVSYMVWNTKVAKRGTMLKELLKEEYL